MAFLKSDTPLDVLKHLLVIGLCGAALLFGFFFIYLPLTTNHGETIVVPKVTGMRVDNLEDYLDERNLRYFVDDSTYNPTIKPFTVLTQDPAPGERVKEDRKIYISVSMKNPPVIKMPKLVDGSVKNAQMILKSYDLQVGKIEFVPDLAQNSVLKQLVNGKEIAAGAPIAKGTRVDLVVGDGQGNQEFPVPNVVNMPEDEAVTLLVGQGLLKGETFYQAPEEGQQEGTVVKQRPVAAPGSTIRTGQLVDLWIAGKAPLTPVN
ncbi:MULTISPECIES: PASTA domain-containing protein [Hymenobacter]|uniref:PASTA domain-containing protein n=1 Tax=Hymenobacter jejuensis TaxID=2502781 RepID=A0A5B7ZUX0_9BACT|nr:MULTISPECIES: PASTA domain-containing protein [Hymenobacter]MBC6988691.1 PASTA domain-containing protein [Hymenobacter sp. BT491]QDA58994.1 PASTA domain-containing protein [Hymenobacter jejuensis]